MSFIRSMIFRFFINSLRSLEKSYNTAREAKEDLKSISRSSEAQRHWLSWVHLSPFYQSHCTRQCRKQRVLVFPQSRHSNFVWTEKRFLSLCLVQLAWPASDLQNNRPCTLLINALTRAPDTKDMNTKCQGKWERLFSHASTDHGRLALLHTEGAFSNTLGQRNHQKYRRIRRKK